eukprot:3891048-Rhodomonas_salina.1
MANGATRMYLVYDVPVAAGLDPTNAARTGGAALSLSGSLLSRVIALRCAVLTQIMLGPGENFGPVQLNPLITGESNVPLRVSACLCIH